MEESAGNNEGISMTRFSVNHVNENPAFTMADESGGGGNHYYTDNIPTADNNYILSVMQMTKEAIPRIDLYRNTKSISYANRPTLDELRHGTTAQRNSSADGEANGVVFDDKQLAAVNAAGHGEEAAGHGHVKFGWIEGVLILNLMSLWGPMLFLRTSWLVAQGGIIEACMVILFATLITTVTSLSTSAIATNGEVKGGGTYYMLSRSLGPEYGGAIGLIFTFANMIGVAMNIVGFCEAMQDLLNEFGLKIVDGGINDTRIIGIAAVTFCMVICIIGMEWEQKAQILFLIILLTAIFDVIVGSFIPPDINKQAKGVTGWSVKTARSNLYENYQGESFISIFSVYFPSSTGILSGANISGELKDPQKSIPKGTLLAICITSLSYILFAIISGFCAVREASGIVENGEIVPCGPGVNSTCEWGLDHKTQMLEIVAGYRWLIYAGNFAATLSSALACLVGAPRVFQALCRDKIYPYIYWFEKGYGKADDPYRCYLLTFIIAVAFILIGDLNAIAPIQSNFFMAAFCLINFAVFHAAISKSPGFRPSFKYWNMWVSVLGAVLCFVIMFVMDYITAIITDVICIFLYIFLYYKKPDVNWGSSSQAGAYRKALLATQELTMTEDHVKNYRPQILVLSGKPSSRPQLVDFSYYITKGIGMTICGDVNKTKLLQRERNSLEKSQYRWLSERNCRAFYSVIEDDNLENGSKALLQTVGVGKLRPNMVLLGYKYNWAGCSEKDVIEYFSILHDAFDRHLAVGILRMQQGLDYSYFTDEMEMARVESNEVILRNSQSQGSLGGNGHLRNAISSASMGSILNTVESSNSLDGLDNENNGIDTIKSKSKKKRKKLSANIPEEIVESINWFHQKQKKGTIDVWWLYDDGGLTLLIPYILSTRKDWMKCRLRVFSLAHSRSNPIGEEERNMASLLSKFRIDCTDVIILSDVRTEAKDSTVKEFHDIIEKFAKSTTVPESDNSLSFSENDLECHKERSNRYMRIREYLKEYSTESTLIVMTLPMPRKRVPTALYMAWLEILTKDMPPFLLIRGNQTSVLTFYS
ncbi:solute carrier 12 [Chamberlinius hualienensis]